MRARLQVQGDTGATFTTTSEPTLADAQAAMDTTCDLMALEVGEGVAERYWPALGACASLGAAAILEAGSYPEQTRSEQSPRPHWQELHDRCVKRLSAVVAADGGATDPGAGGAGVALDPLGCFPCGELVSGRPW